MDIRFNPYNPIHICKAAINFLMKRYDNNDIFGAKDIFKGANHIGYSEGGLAAIGEHHSMIMVNNAWGKGDEIKMGRRHVCLDCGHGDRVEGYFHEVINCPKCDGLYVDTFRAIHYKALLRPDKAKEEPAQGEEKVADVTGEGIFVDGQKIYASIKADIFAGEEVIPLLTITLDDINSVPVVHYKGEEVKGGKIRVSFDWKTGDFDVKHPPYIGIEHVDEDSQHGGTKFIQYNHPDDRD